MTAQASSRTAVSTTGEEEGGTKKSVAAAFTANFLIAIGKFAAGILSGSAALLAEAAHSVADTLNQLFLLLGMRLSKSGPNAVHPFGRGKERFFWSLVVALGLFVAGAVFSLYRGIQALLGESAGHHSFLLGYIVLGAAAVFEGAALVVSTREFRRSATAEGHSFLAHLRRTRNVTLKVPVYEDTAALAGLVIAAAGLGATQLTGNSAYDAVASMGIGVLLVVVAVRLGADCRQLLLGEAALPHDRQRIFDILRSFPQVTDVLRLLTMHMGPNALIVNAELHLVDGLDTDQIEQLLERITARIRADVPEASHTFFELHPRQPTTMSAG